MKRVVMLMSASRAGSSVVKRMLAEHPDVMSLAGEEEPYFVLTGNGYGLSSDSDAFGDLYNGYHLRALIEQELAIDDYKEAWRWRLRLQFTRRDFDLSTLNPADPWEWLREQGIAGYYDGCGPEERRPFDLDGAKLEEPPFVLPKIGAQHADTLLLKTPQNAYRSGVLESVFGEAEFRYIHLTRNFAASMNGLMDAWASDYGFFAHLVGDRWWKLDMPPGWSKVFDRPLADRAFFQWEQANRAILAYGREMFRVRFEDFLVDPARWLGEMFDYAGLRRVDVGSCELPLVMATNPPEPRRWSTGAQARADNILSYAGKAHELMERMGYSMDPDTWD